MEYCCSIWDPYTVEDKKKLEGIQRRAARFVKHDYDWHSSVTSMLKELNWLSLEERRRNIRMTMMFKVVNGLVAIDSQDISNRIVELVKKIV